MTWHPFCDLPLSLRASLPDVDTHSVETPDSGCAMEVHVP